MKKILAAVTLTLGILAIAPPALAVTWYSQGSPLRVYESGVTQGTAFGDFKNNNGVSARSYSQQMDAKPGGQGVYVETSFYYMRECSDGAVEYCYDAKKSTTNTTVAYYVSDYTATYLEPSGTAARGQMKICENHNLAPDPCSATVVRSFSY
ncbi:hypothetical protein [Marmoricola sp. RAF53]|uniref:hypothetical protein n=1 Tax=Marmoricola sp. RAF53 TaxID=3233059 RepID=UPI003F99B316